MDLVGESKKIYEFADFRLIPGEGLLLNKGIPVNLNPKAFAMLTLLVERHGHLVSKSEITDTIWDDSFVEEGVISKAVWFIRNALCDTSKEGFIQTVPRRGYRFVAPVSVLNGLSETPATSEFISTGYRLPTNNEINVSAHEYENMTADVNGHLKSIASELSANDQTVEALDASEGRRVPRPLYRSSTVWAALAVVVFGSIAVYLIVNWTGPLGRGAVNRLAVLPFKPLDVQNRDPLYEFGIAEQLILKLGADKKLSVRQLDAVRRYADVTTDAVKAGKEQKVDYVVSGSYQIANGRIKVTAQLFDVLTGNVEATLFTENELTSAFSAQEAIADGIGSKLLARFGSRPTEVYAKRGTENEEANKLYLLAMNLGEERGLQNVQKSLEYLDRAVELDPNYAVAWAEKAHAHRDIVGHTDSRQHEHYRSSMVAIQRALSIDPNLSEAHSALCNNRLRYEYDMPGAEAACKRAIELDPNSPVARKVYTHFLSSRGRFDEAIAQIRTAMDLQPVSFRNQQIYALALFFARRHIDEEAQWKRLIELNPNHTYVYGRLALCLKQQGRDTEAFEFFIKKLALDKVDARTIVRLKSAYEASGWRGVTIERTKDPEAEGRSRAFDLACLYAALGEKDKAFDLLEVALQERSHRLAMIRVEPQLDPLRNDPRFDDLVRRVEGGK